LAATTTTEASPATAEASAAETGGTTTAAATRARSAVSPGTAAKGVPVSAAVPRDIAAVDPIGSADSRTAADPGAAGAISEATRFAPVGHTGPARAPTQPSARASAAAQIPASTALPLLSASLALGKRIAARAASEPIRSGPVTIGRAAPVLRIVRPVAAARGQVRGAVCPANAAGSTDSTNTANTSGTPDSANSARFANAADAANSANDFVAGLFGIAL
jgi:hypothetical protein